MSSVDTDGARARLTVARLAALTRDHLGLTDVVTTPVPGGAVSRCDGRVAAMAADGSQRSVTSTVAAALVWADRTAAGSVDLFGDAEAAGALARCAGHLSAPPDCWSVDGKDASPAVPVPLPEWPALPSDVAALADEIRAGGADVVVQHGIVIGEVEGLEVARAVAHEDGARFHVGVGAVDQEAWAIMGETIGIAPATADLERIVAEVRRHRPGDGSHPFARFCPEGALKARLVRDPSIVGAATLAPVPTPDPRPDLRTPWPSAAAGDDLDGEPLLVVCSVGIHPDAVVTAAEMRAVDDRQPRTIVVVPERDRHDVLVSLGRRFDPPIEIVGVSPTPNSDPRRGSPT